MTENELYQWDSGEEVWEGPRVGRKAPVLQYHKKSGRKGHLDKQIVINLLMVFRAKENEEGQQKIK